MDKTNIQKGILDETSSYLKRQNFYSLKRNFSQQKLSEILSKNENEEIDTSDDQEKFNFIRQETLTNAFEDYQDSFEKQSKLLIGNRPNMFKSVSDRKLLRNNSFRAAIGEIQIQPNSGDTASTKNSVTPKKKCSLTRSATNDFRLNHISNDDFDFKMPKPIPSSPFSKSISMNFSTVESSNHNETKKRKARLSSSSSNSISSSTTLTEIISKPKPKINKNNLTNVGDHKSRKQLTSENSQILHKIVPSMSMSNLNSKNLSSNLDLIEDFTKNSTKKYLANYSSLRNLNSLNSTGMIRSNLSLNELSSFIKINLPKEKKKTANKAKKNLHENSEALLNVLSVEIDSEIFHFILNSFRLCALMLPPTDKRKLHLLLRFLNKLKHNKYTAKYLLPASFNNYEDLKFIDTSHNSIHETSNIFKRSHLNSELESKSVAIESMIIKAFLKTIISIDHEQEDENKQKLAVKLVQILIDNYTEIMRIPEDLKSNVSQKINAERKSLSEKQHVDQHQQSQSTHTQAIDKYNKYGRCTSSKLTLQQYDQQKKEFTKQELTNMLNNILTDVNMSEKERMHRIKKFQDSYPSIYEENKKALNVLGISESSSSRDNSDFEFVVKKRDFSTDSAFKKSSLFLSNVGGGGGSSSKRLVSKISSSSASGSSASSSSSARNLAFNLNRTSIISSNQSSSKNSMTSMLQATSSINFSKLFKHRLSRLKLSYSTTA